MPTIPMFYGVIIRMYCAPGEHKGISINPMVGCECVEA